MEFSDRKMMQATLADELHYRIGQLADPAAGDCLSLLGLLTKLTFELEDEVTRPVTNQSLTMLYDGLGRLIGRRNANSPAGDEYVALNGAIRNYTQTMALLVAWEFGPAAARCGCGEAPAEPPCKCTEDVPVEAPCDEPCECAETPCECAEATPAEAPCECAEAESAEPPCECIETASAPPADSPCECAEAAPAPGEQPPICTSAADEGEHRPGPAR